MKGKTKADLDENTTGLARLLSTVREQFEPVKARVTGEIPSWLNGEMVRTGTGMFEINSHKFNHWFDGMSIPQKFSINDDEVTFQSKYLRSDTFTANMTKQRIAVTELGTVKSPDPCDSWYSRFLATFDLRPEPGDSCNINIWPFEEDEYFVATETPHIRTIPSDTGLPYGFHGLLL